MCACAFTHVILPSTVVELVDGAFNNCTELEEIHLNEGLQRFDGFNDCASLKSISIPSTVTEIICSFEDCTSLVEVQLCEGLETIDESFCGCTSLMQISIPSTISGIDSSFIDCFSLVEVHLCEGLETISKATFRRVPLLHLNIPSTITAIELDAFQDCTFLRNIAVSPSSTPGKIDLDESFKQFLCILGLGSTTCQFIGRVFIFLTNPWKVTIKLNCSKTWSFGTLINVLKLTASG